MNMVYIESKGMIGSRQCITVFKVINGKRFVLVYLYQHSLTEYRLFTTMMDIIEFFSGNKSSWYKFDSMNAVNGFVSTMSIQARKPIDSTLTKEQGYYGRNERYLDYFY